MKCIEAFLIQSEYKTGQYVRYMLVQDKRGRREMFVDTNLETCSWTSIEDGGSLRGGWSKNHALWRSTFYLQGAPSTPGPRALDYLTEHEIPVASSMLPGAQS